MPHDERGVLGRLAVSITNVTALTLYANHREQRLLAARLPRRLKRPPRYPPPR